MTLTCNLLIPILILISYVNAIDLSTEIVFGIFSISNPVNLLNRNLMRDYYKLQAYNKSIYSYVFVFDRNEDVHEQDRIHNDFMVLNSTFTGRANHFGEKMYLFYKYSVVEFPNAKFIAKIDDDVLFCVAELYSNLMSYPNNHLIYYGWSHFSQSVNVKSKYESWGIELNSKINNKTLNEFYLLSNLTHKSYIMMSRMDEYFVVVGRGLVDRIVSRPLCSLRVSNESLHNELIGLTIAKCLIELKISATSNIVPLIDLNSGGTSLAVWLSLYRDVNFIPKNKDGFIHYKLSRNIHKAAISTSLLQQCQNCQFIYSVMKKPFCENFLVYHKAHSSEMEAFVLDLSNNANRIDL